MERGNDPTLIAAIVAAVAGCLERSPEEVRLVGVRHLGNASAQAGPSLWALAGRQAQMARRLTAGRKESR